jgi:DNA excision repair protein ERCC-4
MFHNIFSSKKKNSKEKIKPTIIADVHEKNSLIISELKSSEDIELVMQPLQIADYLINNIAIERKTTSDLLSSMLSKRIFEQLKQLQQYEQSILIIEGNKKNAYMQESNIHPNAIRGFILSIIQHYPTNLLFTDDETDTAQYLITLTKQQLKPKIQSTLHARIPKTLKEQKQYILEAFPNIGPKKAEQLLEKYKTLNKIFNRSEKELSHILSKDAKIFKDILEE